jgi:transcriptional regulator with XRE-family HTH domain
MTKTTILASPTAKRILTKIGNNIKLARLRRNFSQDIVAKRAFISRSTLVSIEKGDPNVKFGAYVHVLISLGLTDELKNIATDDVLGRRLQDLGLSVRKKSSRIFSTKDVKE